MKKSGFTLIELMVVLTIISLGIFLLLRVRERILLNETVNLFVADIRNAQFKTLSSTRYSGAIRCGYGIHDNYDDSTSYFVYVGNNASGAGVDCATQDRRFCGFAPGGQWEDDIQLLPLRKLFSPNFEFKGGVSDSNFGPIFFEPPYPTTFLCSPLTVYNCPPGLACGAASTGLSLAPTIITIGYVGQTCASAPCQSICVYTSGRIEVVSGTICP